MIKHFRLTAAAALIGAASAMPIAAFAEVNNIVLVHGMNMTGGLWRDVYDLLKARDYSVSVAQMPLTSFEADIAAVDRIVEIQDGPMLLVGHSYGGVIIGDSGQDPDVAGLVYIAGFIPDIGETQAGLASQFPSHLTPEDLHFFDDGHFLISPSGWTENVANGAAPADASFTAHAQIAGHSASFTYETTAAAWQDKPTWSVITSKDRTIAPSLQRHMSQRAKAVTFEIDAGHLVPMTDPTAIVDVIVQAAQAVD